MILFQKCNEDEGNFGVQQAAHAVCEVSVLAYSYSD